MPKLMFQQKWFKSDKELKEGDLVYFRKRDSKLDDKWIVGAIDTLERGRDGLIRMVQVKYKNAGENHLQVTTRTVRQLVKLWSIDDHHLAEDLAEMERKFGHFRTGAADEGTEEDPGHDATMDVLDNDDDEVDGKSVSNQTDDGNVDLFDNSDMLLQVETDSGDEEGGSLDQQQGGDVDSHSQPGGDDGPPAANTRSKQSCSNCCCHSHHKYSLHVRVKQAQPLPMALELSVHPKLVSYYKENLVNEEQATSMIGCNVDEMIMSVGINLRL